MKNGKSIVKLNKPVISPKAKSKSMHSRNRQVEILRNQALNSCILASKNRDNKHLLEMCILKSQYIANFEEEEQSY